MPAHIDSAIWGDRFDAWTTLWLIEHLSERIGSLNFHAETTEILYPIGYNLWSFGHMALQAIGGLLVTLGVPLVTSYNMLLIGSIWTSALGAHALGFELTRSHLSAGVAGVVFASTPYLYAEAGAGCIELVAAGLLPIHALCMVRLLRAPSKSRMWVAAFVLAIIGPFNWYYTLFAGLFAAGFLCWHLIEVGAVTLRKPGPSPKKTGLKLAVLSLLIAAFIDAPLIMNARRETPKRPSVSAELFSSETAFTEVRSVTNGAYPLDELSAELLQRVDAMQVHFNSTSIRALIDGRFESNPLQSTPGSLAFGVGIVGLLLGGRRTWGWAGIAAGTTCLTLGPFLNISGSLLLEEASNNWPLPYYWAHEFLPFFAKAYRPYRICVVASMCLAVMGSIGAAAWMRSARRPSLLFPLLILGVVGFSQPHWSGDKPAHRPMASTSIDDAFYQLAKKEQGGVISLPLHYQPVSTANARIQYQQTAHKHPILNSNQLIRWPDLLRFKDHVQSNEALNVFVDLSRKATPYSVSSDAIADLVNHNYRWVVAHRSVKADKVELAGEMVTADLLPPPAWRLLNTLFGTPTIDTESTVVWDINNHEASDTPTLESATGIHPIALLFDPIETGFPLVLAPGQTLPLYSGPAKELHAWILATDEAANLSLRIEGQGIVREQPLELPEGFWQYTTVELDQAGDIELSLVGRGDYASKVHITQAGVIQ